MKRLAILVFHLVSLSLAIYFRPDDLEVELMKVEDWDDMARFIAECVTIGNVLGYIFVQQGGEMYNIGIVSFLRQLVSGCRYISSIHESFVFYCGNGIIIILFNKHFWTHFLIHAIYFCFCVCVCVCMWKSIKKCRTHIFTQSRS